MESVQLAICRSRLYNRLPLVGGWLRQRAVRRLRDDASADAIQFLEEAVTLAKDGEVRAAAFEALEELGPDHAEAREALCRLYLDHDHPGARQAALTAGYAPRDPGPRAVFYFLTRQWEEYEGLDFDGRLLRAVYDAAEPKLRARIATRARQSGRLEWVEVASGGKRGRRLGDMTEQEWLAALSVLDRRRRYDEIWRLAQQAPPRWSAVLVRKLGERGWSPPGEAQAPFAALTDLARRWKTLDVAGLFRARAVLQGHADSVRCLEVTPDGQTLVSGGEDGKLCLWDLADGKLLAALDGLNEPIRSLALTPDGTTAITAGNDRRIDLWDLPGRQIRKRYKGHLEAVVCLAVAPPGDLFATGSADRTLRLWRLPGGEPIGTLEGHLDGVVSLALTPDGRYLVSGSGDCSARVWAIPEGNLLQTLGGHRTERDDAVLCVAVSPDGRTLATGGTDGLIQLWGLPGGDPLPELAGHLNGVYALAFTPDGTLLASGGEDSTVRLWDVAQGRLKKTLEGHVSTVSCLAVSPDGRLLASASGEGYGHDYSVKIWRVGPLPEGKPLRTLEGHTRSVTALRFTPGGTTLASASRDGTVRLWTADLARLCSRPARQSGPAELSWAESLLRDSTLTDDEREALAFTAALLRWGRRHDIQLGEAATQRVELGAFDIEIEG